MAASFSFPGPFNTFIADHAASNKLVVDFARKISDFGVNKYTQVIPVKKVKGYYLEMQVEQCARVLYTDGRDKLWADGQPAPEGNENTEAFKYLPYETIRYTYPFLLGDLTVDQASWNILAQHASIMARQAMTQRTQFGITAATTTGNWDASHRLDVTTISGNTGTWPQSTTARQDIRRSITTGLEVILDDTNAAVSLNDLVLVINSALAADIAQSQELVDYIKGSPEALAEVRGEKPNDNVIYNLPAKLYGVPLVVELTRKVTSKKGATAARSQVLGKTTPFIVSRPGGLEGVADSPNFATIQCFAQEEMAVETLRDANNRRTMGRVVENLVYKVVAKATGILYSNAA